SIMNFGAPVAEGALVAGLDLMKGGLERQKHDLDTAMKMHAEASAAQIELINGEAEIQKEIIDAAQAAVDAQQDLIGVVQANLRLRNQLVSAKNLWMERQKAYDITASDTSNDVSARVLRDAQSFAVFKARSDAAADLLRAANALQYEINTKVPEIEG